MSRPNGLVDAQFDEQGFEVPFSEKYEGEALGDPEGTFGEHNESPFTESTFSEANLEESSFEEADSWSEAEDEAPLTEDETFPSGLVLQPASGATGRNQEHWDPHQTGVPLLATGPDVQSQRISPHFTVGEFVTSGGRAASVARISPELVRVLEAIRVRAGKAVRITSGYRSWAKNKQVYAARGKKPTDSRHCSGQAADISVSGMLGLNLAKLAIDAAGTNLGLGIGNTFIHVDVRGSWVVWSYFPRGGEADQTAVAALAAHRARALRGAKPAPMPAPRPPAPQPVPTPAGGPSGRLVVTKHPLLQNHRGTPPDLILRWHQISQPGEIDVVVHFHGYGSPGQGEGVRIDLHKERSSGLDFANPASRGGAGRTRPTLAILPRGNYFGGRHNNAYNFPSLTPRGALQTLIQDALARVTRATGHAVQMGRLILTGHSGGGAPLTLVLSHTDPDEVHVFDGLYGSGAAIASWAERRIARELASPAALPPAMRVLYRPGSKQFPGTQPHSEALARRLFPALSGPAAASLKPFFRVEMTRVDHNAMPSRFGWMLLADAGGDVPDSTLHSGAPRASREAAFETHEESGEGFEPEGEVGAGESELSLDETLAWLDVEALAGEAIDENEGEAEAEEAEEEAEADAEGVGEAEEEATLSEGEWAEGEAEESGEGEDEGVVERFDAFDDERDAEWELSEDEEMFEGEGPLAAGGLSTAEQKAVEITSLFETGKRGGFYGLSGNFDGQGLSFGLVNWTIGTGSLQPLLRDFAREQPARWVTAFGPHAAAFLQIIAPSGKEAVKAQHKFAVEVMNTSSIVKGSKRWAIKEPWVTYFKRLSEDREFQQIQVRYVRDLLARGEYFCRYFKLTSEMAFAFMFDAVSSHGKWWLTKKFKGQEKRRLQIEQKLRTLSDQHGTGRVPEADILLAIADVLAATSAARWAANVRRRKRWFVTGEHPRAKELKGLGPRPDIAYSASARVEPTAGSAEDEVDTEGVEFEEVEALEWHDEYEASPWQAETAEPWIGMEAEESAWPVVTEYGEAEPALDQESFLEVLGRLLNPGAIMQRVQELLGSGIFGLSLMSRFASGKIWNEDHLALEVLFHRQPSLKPAGLDTLAGSTRLKRLNALASKHNQALTSIREGVVRPIFGSPANFQVGPSASCQIHDLRQDVRRQGRLVGGTINGRVWYKRNASASPRRQAVIDSIVLHHMAFNRGNDLQSYLKVGAHYAVMADGQIAQLYDDLDFLNASNGFNPRSVAIEFAGNFPSVSYLWWKDPKASRYDRCYLTPEQIRAGRCLLSTLKSRLPGIRYVYAHRQSTLKEGDPGPDVWFNVAEWAIANLGLTDRLPQTHIGKGSPIPNEWRVARAAIAWTAARPWTGSIRQRTAEAESSARHTHRLVFQPRRQVHGIEAT